MLFAASAASADMASYSADMHRMDVSSMDCSGMQSEMGSRPAILRWQSKSGLPRWGKYMTTDGSCKMQNIKARTSVKTSDGACQMFQCNQYGRSASR